MANLKQFATRLNKSLDELGLPSNQRERSAILSKLLSITRQQAWMLVEGNLLPDEPLLASLTRELEVDAKTWL